MAEYPYDKPTTSMGWATGASPGAIDAGVRSSGYTLDTTPTYKSTDRLWKDQGDHADWLKLSGQPRAFDSLRECATKTPDGRLVMLRVNQSWGDAAIERTTQAGTGFAVGPIAVDGLRVYYVQNGTLYGDHADPATSGNDWSRSLASMGTIKAIHTDGVIVAVIGSQAAAEDTLVIVDADTGVVVYTDNTFPDWDFVFCDSNGTARRVLLARLTGTGIYLWKDAGSVLVFILTGANVLNFMVTPEYLAVRFTGGGGFYDKAAVLLHTDQAPNGFCAGHVRYAGGVRSGILNGASQSAAGLTGSAIVALDERHLFQAETTNIRAAGGSPYQVLQTWVLTFGATYMACDGQYLWHNGSSTAGASRLEALPIERAPSIFWRADMGGPGAWTVHRAEQARMIPLVMGDY